MPTKPSARLFCQRVARRVFSLAALAGCLGCSAAQRTGPEPYVAGGSQTTPLPDAPVSVKAGDRVERTIGEAGQTELLLELEAGRYVRLQIEQSRADVKAILVAPSGQQLAEADLPQTAWRPEVIPILTGSAGAYRLTIIARPPFAPTTAIGIEVSDNRPAIAGDEDRIIAERELAAAISLRLQQGQSAGWDQLALRHCKEALELWQNVGDDGGVMEASVEIGNVFLRTGPPAEAVTWFKKALGGPDGERFARLRAQASRNLGVALLKEDPGGARRYFEDALALWAGPTAVADRAEVLYAIGTTYASQAEDSKALDYYQRALPLAKDAGLLPLQAQIWNAIAVVHTTRGDRQPALQALEQALVLAEQPGSRESLAPILTGTGLQHRRLGELRLALSDFERALAINQQAGISEEIATVLSHLGATYLDLGETDMALKYYDKALAEQPSTSRRAYTLYLMGQVYLDLKRPEAALNSYQMAFEAAKKANSPRHQAAALHGIGLVWMKSGKFQEAQEAFEKALPLRRSQGDRIGEAMTLVELGDAFIALGDTARGAALLAECLQIARAAGASFVQVAAHKSLARLERELGDLEQAKRNVEQAIKILESIRSDLPSDRLRSSFFAAKRSYYDLYVDILMRLDQRQPGRGFAADALRASEAARARSLLDLLAEGRLDVKRGISAELKEQEHEVNARLSQIQRDLTDKLSVERPDEARIAVLREQLSLVEESRLALERTIRNTHRRYAEVRYPSPLELAEIRDRQLDEQTALLEYVLGEDSSYLFVVTKESLTVARLPELGLIEPLARRLRRSLVAGRRGWTDFRAVAQQLYQLLIEPAGAALTGKRRLLVAPDGPLYQVPFETLLTHDAANGTPGSQPYLLKDFAISYVPSASVLSWLSESGPRPPSSKRFLAFADPVYPVEKTAAGDPAKVGSLDRGAEGEVGRLPRLPETEREVAEIAALYSPGEVMIYRREDATEAQVKGNPLVGTARRLHFATHGMLNEERPELSGLLLTRSDRLDDDGILQVYEIFNLELSAELVVLSACETAGAQLGGEGLVGMSRAFFYAGAPSVVVSLWRVRDDSARQLMVHLYQALDEQVDRSTALRGAKLAMLRGDMAHPAHWAPFVLVGQP